MKRSITIGNIEVQPGSKGYGAIHVANRGDGAPVGIPVCVVNGSEDGPRLWMLGCSHADEIGTTLTVTRTVNSTDPKKLKGAIIGIPVINFPALEAGHATAMGQRLNPIDQQNLNRTYLGNPNGLLSDRMTYRLIEELKNNADYVIDLHDGGWGNFFGKQVFYHKFPGKLGETTKELVIASGLEVIWCSTEALPFSGPNTGAATIKIPKILGIPCIGFEVGGSTGRFEGREWSINVRLEATQNIMKHLRMIEGKPNIPTNQKIIVDAW
ncbi:succinylglutamate desuccinylase/aspartoacylase family protein, partial [bacterium]|nr:succinylglutamate desuccinylase/aspartoacylase family protein [bacterium]